MRAVRALLLLSSLALSGCGLLPGHGPSISEIRAGAYGKGANFVLMPIDANLIAHQQGRFSSAGTGAVLRDSGIPVHYVKIGDTLDVTIFEASGEGLFNPGRLGSGAGGSAGTRLPTQVIGQDGAIFLPYVGRVRVANMSLAEISGTLARALRGKAVDPQVVVTIANNRSNAVTVLGAVAKSGIVPLNPAGERILDVLAQSGGTTGNSVGMTIHLIRDNMGYQVPLAQILSAPAQNVMVQPGDTIYVKIREKTYSVMGAVNRPDQFAIDRERLTLAQALGKAGGLNDDRADPEGLFVFRYEPATFLSRMLPERDFAEGGSVPVIYQISLEDPVSYHHMQRFVVMQDDVIYAANAPAAELGKFLRILNSSTQAVTTPLLIGTAISQ